MTSQRCRAGWIQVACLVALGGGVRPCAALDAELAKQAAAGLRQAVEFLRRDVAVGGGYLGTYLADLSDQWGESHATRDQNWIQPPGCPSVGFAFLRAYEATGDGWFLEAAKEVANSLVYGQLECGGWDYIVDHSPAGARNWFYRHNRSAADPALRKGRNQATFDDNTTQHATRLLMAVDQALQGEDAAIHEAAQAALELFLKAQHASGGWPQRYPASGRGYGDFFTFNDNSMRDCLDVMMIASRQYGDQRHADAVRKCGEFILKTRLPEPQPVWAQQYDFDLQPAWARRFEPVAVSASESGGVLRILVEIALFTGDAKYLEPIPPAVAWYQRSVLPDGQWARFYELKTNRPLYMISGNRTLYWLTYDDTDIPDHYSFKGRYFNPSIQETHDRIRAQGLTAYAAARQPKPQTEAQRRAAAEALEPKVKEVLGQMDARGAWVTKGGSDQKGQPAIDMAVFQRQAAVLSDYLKLVNGR